MDKLIDSFNRVPAPLWALIGSFGTALITFIGIFVNNRASEKRLRLQLQNDRDLRKREREMEFRLEVYAAGAEALSVIANLLTRLSDVKVSQDDVSAAYQENCLTSFRHSPFAAVRKRQFQADP
jgi:hypothetical protein